jgi:hypothetical protein
VIAEEQVRGRNFIAYKNADTPIHYADGIAQASISPVVTKLELFKIISTSGQPTDEKGVREVREVVGTLVMPTSSLLEATKKILESFAANADGLIKATENGSASLAASLRTLSGTRK